MEVRAPLLCQKSPRGLIRRCCHCKERRARYRPQSFAPKLVYEKPCLPFERNTIYRKSYLPCTTIKATPFKPANQIRIQEAVFSKDTINRLSYPGWCGIKPAKAVLPDQCLKGFHGCMQQITTNKHDYGPKKIPKTEICRPQFNIVTPNQPLSNKTINRLSYCPNVCIEKTEKILPKPLLERLTGPMASATINKMSYRPVQLGPKEEFPWAKKTIYEVPNVPMASGTVYNCSYLPNCDFAKTQLIKPAPNIQPCSTIPGKFDDRTIFKMSYQPQKSVMQQKILPKSSLKICGEKMEKSTINKMSFLPNYGFKPPMPILPKVCQIQKGPMQEITTNRHDYIPKAICKVLPILPKNLMEKPCEPMSNLTINRLSYQPTCLTDMPKPILPTDQIARASGKMESMTVNRMSYQPVCAEKLEVPWAQNKCYEPPNIKMSCNTVYNMSYEDPLDLDCVCRCYENNPLCVEPVGAC